MVVSVYEWEKAPKETRLVHLRYLHKNSTNIGTRNMKFFVVWDRVDSLRFVDTVIFALLRQLGGSCITVKDEDEGMCSIWKVK